MLLSGKSCQTGRWIEIETEGARIARVLELAGKSSRTSAEDDVWLAPGFIDLQVNGYRGISYNLDSWTAGEFGAEAFLRLDALLAASGTTQYFPTVITNHMPGLLGSLRGIAAARAECPELQTAIPGIHLEGPYISSAEGARGAHPLECIRDPDWSDFQRLQEAADGLIKIVTLAPERDSALPFIEKAVASGVVISIGHTAANSAQVAAAVRAGARKCTHLGNGCPALLPRHPNVIWDQLAEDELYACFIADGFHVAANAIKAMMKAKGPQKSILVSDVVPLGGMAPGLYDNDRHEVLPSGSVVLAGTPYLAGAGFLLDHCIGWSLARGGLNVPDIPRVASVNPAALMGLVGRGTLEAGAAADLVQFRVRPGDGLEILNTVRGGRTIHARTDS